MPCKETSKGIDFICVGSSFYYHPDFAEGKTLVGGSSWVSASQSLEVEI